MPAELRLDLSPMEDQLGAGVQIPTDLPWSGRAHAYLDVVAIGADHPPLARCTHHTVYQPVWGLDGGRRDVPLGPVFTDRGSASQLIRLLNGEAEASREDGDPALPTLEMWACAACGTPLPPRSRPHRMTCGETCRQRLARERRLAAQAGGPGDAPAPPSGLPARDGAGRSPTAVSLTGPTESVTARPTVPAARLRAGSPGPGRPGRPGPGDEAGHRVNGDDRDGRAGGA